MEIREKIEIILKDLVPGINVSSDCLLREEGVKSLTVVQLISELDLAFDIEITFNDIVQDNFRSVDTIEKMVKTYLKR